MRKTADSINAESYRILTGPSADKSVHETDSRSYHKGHLFGGGVNSDGKDETIGYSSSSKVWSNKSLRIPHLIEWCEMLSAKIAQNAPVVTNSGVDHLSTPIVMTELPTDIITVRWHDKAYAKPGEIVFKSNGSVQTHQQLNMSFRIDREASTSETIIVESETHGPAYQIEYSIVADELFTAKNFDAENVRFIYGDYDWNIIEYLNKRPLQFFTSGFSRLNGDEILMRSTDDTPPFNHEKLEVVDWTSESVDIHTEIGVGRNNSLSIHSYLKGKLSRDQHDLVLYDHGTRENCRFNNS